MPEKPISERLDDLETIRESLKQLASLQEDFELLVQYSYVARQQIELVANGGGPPNIDPAFREKCRAFVKKYGSSF